MKNGYKKVLFINYGGIGDEILFLPAIEGFKSCYPDSKITLCTEKRAAGIKSLTSLIDEIITVDIKAGGIKKYLNVLKFIFKVRFMGFDLVVSSGKSPFVSIILFMTGIKFKAGYKTKTSKLLTYEIPLNENVYAGQMYFDLVAPFCKAEFKLPSILYDKNIETPYDDFILIHPGVSLMSVEKGIFKCPEVSFWIEVIKKLLLQGEKVILAGGPDDEKTITTILSDEEIKSNVSFASFYGKTKNLYELAGLIKKASSVICCDSAPLHMAVGLNKNIYVLFGPTNEKKLVPLKDNIKVIKKETGCRPCLWDKRLKNCENSRCIEFSADELLNCMK